jgi:hypothetical protein
MPARDLTPLDRSAEQLDAAAELDVRAIEAAEQWARQNMPAPFWSAAVAELYEPPEADAPR